MKRMVRMYSKRGGEGSISTGIKRRYPFLSYSLLPKLLRKKGLAYEYRRITLVRMLQNIRRRCLIYRKLRRFSGQGIP